MGDLLNSNLPIEELIALFALRTSQSHEDDLRRKMQAAEEARRAEKSQPPPSAPAPQNGPRPSPGIMSELFGWLTD